MNFTAHQNIPAVGIHRDVPADVYHGWDCASNSRLCRLLKSPAHLICSLNEPDDDTVEKLRGTAAHAAILEPARFNALYAGGPCVKLNTKDGKTEWQAFIDANPGKIHVRGEEWVKVCGVRDAVWNHANARRLLEARSDTELSVVWTDKPTGLACKARLDITVEVASVVIDVKTCRDARPDAFSKVICDRHYYRQGAMYLEALAQFGHAFDQFWNIAVESDPPHGVMLYKIADDALDQGRAEIRDALELYAECKQSGVWPGYPVEVVEVGLPVWKQREAS